MSCHPELKEVLFKTFQREGIFKRKHLAELSGVNDNTLKTYLRFLHLRTGRITEERKATRFTGLEAMAVILMAQLQTEWEIRPEKSFATAYWLAGHFVDQVDRARAGFPGRTFTATFDADYSTGVVSQVGAEFLAEIQELRPPHRLAFLGFSDQAIYELAFLPVVRKYTELAGVEIFPIAEKESRRDDAHHK